jgi:hypothetical protein
MRLFWLLILLISPHIAVADNIYQQPAEFISEAFEGAPPVAKVFWIGKETSPQITKIMGHHYPILKIKYWLKNKRSVWVLEEIGKVKPITTGIVIDDGKIAFLKVLIYRESHGWQVKRAFFTDQFKEVALIDGEKLSHAIDGISGATMSVDALRNLTKLALFLYEQVIHEK